MKKKVISAMLSIAMLASFCGAFTVPASAAGRGELTRQVEYLTRGLVAVRVDGGIYLSWRLLGTEELTQKFDVYRDGKLIKSALDATNYTDDEGFSYNKYQVVPTGTAKDDIGLYCDETEVWSTNYIDIPLDKPAGGVARGGESYTYSVNDTSVADVDGDGEYEYIIKWDPSNSKDNSQTGYTGNVLLDCYKIDGTKLWRIDLGVNIRAGAHYTQFIAYDFDGDGKAEVAMRTAPGSKDSTGQYVSRVGAAPKLGSGVAADPFTWKDTATGTTYKDTDDLRQTSGKYGHIIKGPDWLTMFNGLTGEAMQTVNYPVQRGSVKDWGDSYGGRSERNVAGVAYLNGTTPSLIMCRGYYARASMGAYDWDGKNFTKLWVRDDKSDKSTLYTNGNHQLTVADFDNDGKDEVAIGSAVADDNGGILHSTGHGHGDALHASDFDNDGNQEIFSVHEEKTYFKTWGAEYRKGSNGQILAKTASNSDTGRGVMANIDDDYANANGFHSYFWSSANTNLYTDKGDNPLTITEKVLDGSNYVDKTVNVAQPSSYNSLVYWDGDLSRELLDRNRIDKFSVTNGQTRLATFDNVHSNNSSKANAAISGDLFGDWREEVAYGTADDTALRIFTTTTPTAYKLTTLMHDTQYRCAIAWQNVGYNQPPHPSYFIGKDSLKSGENYLEPKSKFDKVAVAHTPSKTVTIPDETVVLLDSSESFNSGAWELASETTTTDAPYKNIITTSQGMTTKELSLDLDDDGEEKNIILKSFTLGASSATAVVENQTIGFFSAKLYAAAYNSDGTLSDVKRADVTVAGGTENSFTTEALNVPSGGYVKAYLWDDNENPYTDVLTAENPSISDQILRNDSGAVETIKLEFDWKPAAAENKIAVLNETDDNIVSLSKQSGGSVQYAAGSSADKTVSSSLTSNANSSWYHVALTMDMTSKTADISVLDYTAKNTEEKIVYAASFAGVDGLPAKLAVTNQTSLDNVDISKVIYNIPRSLVKFSVEDSSGNPVSDAKISIGSNTLTTDESGNASIKIKNGDYSYTVSKAEKKTVKGTVTANSEQNIEAEMAEGEQRNIYVKYMYDGAVDISEAVSGSANAIGTAKENTTYTLPDSAKKDITGYTFPTDEDDIVPGYESLAGQTYNFEFDPDKSDVVDTTIGEGADTTIVLAYKIKRVPTSMDTELLRIQYGEGGIGSDGANWSLSSNAQYEDITDNGKFLKVENLGASTLTVNIPKAQTKMVMEYDMRYEDMPWGGEYFGMTPYSGNTAGQGFGLRSSREANAQWELCYRTGGSDNYLTKVNNDKNFTYAYNWRNQWMHVIVVADGTSSLKVTVSNKDTGVTYVQDQPVPVSNGVGSTLPINKVVFCRQNGSGNATVGFKNFKAYTVNSGASGSVVIDDAVLTIPSTTSFSYTDALKNHASDAEGTTYDASSMVDANAMYIIVDESGNSVTPSGYKLNASTGVLTASEDADTSQTYYIATYLNGTLAKKTRLSYLTKKLITHTEDFSGGLSGFTITKKDGYAVTADNGTVKYTKTAGTNYDSTVYLDYPVTNDDLSTDGMVSFDYMINSAAFKGYMYFVNSSKQEVLKMETHLYEPRFKVPTESGTKDFKTINKNTWYTFVIEFNNGKGTISIYDRDNDPNHESPLITSTYTPSGSPKGLTFRYQVAQNKQNGSADYTDEYYFDNFTYGYYDYSN